MKRCISMLLVLVAITTLLPTVYAYADTIRIPSNTTVIEAEAFSGIRASTVIIPQSVSEIQSRAFAGNSFLTDVYLPNTNTNIADDAFDKDHNITFHVYFGSDLVSWAQNNNYNVEYITDEETGSPSQATLSQAISVINSSPISGSGTQLGSDNYATSRLILKIKSGESLLDLTQYQPVAVIPFDTDIYLIQFETPDEASICESALRAWDGCQFVEPDYFIQVGNIGETGSSSSPNSMLKARSVSSDPMGFDAYVNYLVKNASNIGNVTVAILDTGVNGGSVDCTVSSKSYDFVSGRSASSDSDGHGTQVAQALCNSFGSLKNHLTIISYKIYNSSDPNKPLDYALMCKAIIQANRDGANYINISCAGSDDKTQQRSVELLNYAINHSNSPIIAAAGNYPAYNANSFIPGRYCTTVGAVTAVNGELALSSLSCKGADYGAYDVYTSLAAPKFIAARALLDIGGKHTLSEALNRQDPNDPMKGFMPELSQLTVKLPVSILLNDGDPIESTLRPGDVLSIPFKVQPTDADDTTIKPVVSTNTDAVQIIEQTGYRVRLRAVGSGDATIVFETNAGNVEDRSTVIHVVQPPTSISITANGDLSAKLQKDQTISLTATVLPGDATNKTVEWTASDPELVQITTSGEWNENAIIKQKGTIEKAVTISAYTTIDPTIIDQVTIIVSPEALAQRLTISPAGGINTIYKGKNSIGTVQMNAVVEPADANQTVVWSSSKPEVATINGNGLVTAVGRGTTTITAHVANGTINDFYDITVVQLPTDVVISGSTSVLEGETIQLSKTVSPSDANDSSVIWSSSNENRATVTGNGIVTGISAGSVVISAKCNADKSIIDTYAITVEPATFNITFNVNSNQGAVCSPTRKTATRGQKVGSLPTPTMNYYDWLGWFTEGGTKVTEDTIFQTTDDITLYAHWSLKPEKGWVPYGNQPSDAQITQTSWSYRELKEDTATSLSGYTQYDNYWKQTGSDSKQYASFPSTYSTSHSTYTELNGSAYEAYENTTAKRTVNNSHAGYVYWHWGYSAQYSERYDRWMSDRKQWAGKSRNLSDVYYQYFFAFKSTTDAPRCSGDFSWTWGANAKYDSSKLTYDCKNCLPSGADKSSNSGLNSPRFLRLEYFTSSYTDYQKIFKYYKDYSYVSSDPGTGSNITNKVKYVKYREK